ncbi:FAD-dependent oxidoreductase [Bizionia sediminis]|uniref:FAD-dependent oxidoreductase n=1 Tax=Bizionia sediminis TaxID=1737064 RepID=A0ABW5KTW2_9FLAO
MKANNQTKTNWTICPACRGRGKQRQRLRKKVRLQYKAACYHFEKSGKQGTPPVKPKGHLYNCPSCQGSGLIKAEAPTKPDTEHLPHVAIIGAGIGGVALAVACLHRGIPFSLFERDTHFNVRSQGYGLTLQQASKAIAGFGIFSLEEGIVSTRHVVHNTNGTIVGEWGMRKWLESKETKTAKRTNIHIARQALRMALLEQLGTTNNVFWGHQLIDFSSSKTGKNTLRFSVNGEEKIVQTNLIVGADGIRSTVRKALFGRKGITPLRYLNCMVILGICPLSALTNISSNLLDSQTVFQTANGHDRIYVMPFTQHSVMWQLSFPITEAAAKQLSKQGSEALKAEAILRTKWHSPIPEIIAATHENKISGYPVYDRALLKTTNFEEAQAVTLIGDAAHPMSPFKGQGANQALLDALLLARTIFSYCKTSTSWRTQGLRHSVLPTFEKDMLSRSAIKVKDSAAAAEFLHSEIVLHKANKPRGRCLTESKTHQTKKD